MGRACSTYGVEEKRKPEGKTPLGKPRRRWVDSIKMDLGRIEWDGVDLIGLVQDEDQWKAIVKAIMSLRVP
jgi:hypothetical protein